MIRTCVLRRTFQEYINLRGKINEIRWTYDEKNVLLNPQAENEGKRKR